MTKEELLRLNSIEQSLFKTSGGLGCDLVTGTSEFVGRRGRIYKIVSNVDDSRIISWKYAKTHGDAPTTQIGLSFFSVKRVDTITLAGTSGTATIVCNGETDTATFNSDLPTTASDFVTANAADYLAAGSVLTSDGAVLTIVSSVAGTDFTGDLVGTPATTTSNSLAAINDNKIIYPDFPLYSITLGKGSVWVYYIF